MKSSAVVASSSSRNGRSTKRQASDSSTWAITASSLAYTIVSSMASTSDNTATARLTRGTPPSGRMFFDGSRVLFNLEGTNPMTRIALSRPGQMNAGEWDGRVWSRVQAGWTDERGPTCRGSGHAPGQYRMAGCRCPVGDGGRVGRCRRAPVRVRVGGDPRRRGHSPAGAFLHGPGVHSVFWARATAADHAHHRRQGRAAVPALEILPGRRRPWAVGGSRTRHGVAAPRHLPPCG